MVGVNTNEKTTEYTERYTVIDWSYNLDCDNPEFEWRCCTCCFAIGNRWLRVTDRDH